MPVSPDKIAELRIKKLEMVQAIIARLAGYGAVIKNWCITVTTAVCGFSVSQGKPSLLLLAFLPIVAFAILDAQYLRAERRFRILFDRISSEDWAALPVFDFRGGMTSRERFLDAICSWSISSFYIPLALGVAFTIFVAKL